MLPFMSIFVGALVALSSLIVIEAITTIIQIGTLIKNRTPQLEFPAKLKRAEPTVGPRILAIPNIAPTKPSAVPLFSGGKLSPM
ncbi:hypothetical protein SDC9_157390 [bioreactor metagenome]|uniref:Uncharacterized protein n=1 Tax=bioreactor metagenome TaxID=1076179 RepID=A0A645F7A7_9ZZZZ